MSRGRVLWLGVALYAILTAAGLAWMWLRGDPLPKALLSARFPAWLAASIGALAAVAIVLVSDAILERFRWTDLLRREVLDLFAPLTVWKACALAVLSGVGEEVFFRGALVPALGLVPAAVVFGLLHGFPDPRFLGWALFACAAGLLFGGLLLWTEGVLAPAVCHVLVNGIQLYRLARQDRGSHTSSARVDRLNDL